MTWRVLLHPMTDRVKKVSNCYESDFIYTSTSTMTSIANTLATTTDDETMFNQPISCFASYELAPCNKTQTDTTNNDYNYPVLECLECGKIAKQSTDMKDHIEANHISCLQFECPKCHKMSKTRPCLRMH